MRAIDELAELNCTRILTSGQARSAEEGISALKEYVEYTKGRLTILPGGGVTPQNAKKILIATGTNEIHGSASGMTEYNRKETLVETVAQIIQEIE